MQDGIFAAGADRSVRLASVSRTNYEYVTDGSVRFDILGYAAFFPRIAIYTDFAQNRIQMDSISLVSNTRNPCILRFNEIGVFAL